jgi:hypothetical protein
MDNLLTAQAMTSQVSRRERAYSDRAQAIPTAARPAMGTRRTSAPAGGLHKLEAARKPGMGIQPEHTLLEEDEGSPSSEATRRTPFRQHEVRSILAGQPMRNHIQLEGEISGTMRMHGYGEQGINC